MTGFFDCLRVLEGAAPLLKAEGYPLLVWATAPHGEGKQGVLTGNVFARKRAF